ILAGTLNVTSGSGGIRGTVGPLSTNATTLTADAGTTGNVFIDDTATTTVNLTGLNQAKSYQLAAGSTDINVALTANFNALQISLFSGGTIALQSNALSATVDGVGNGGSISLIATSILGSAASSVVVLSANGTGTGNGGIVILNLSTASLIGTVAPIVPGTALTLNATSGATGGHGGAVSLMTTSTLFVETTSGGVPTGINVSPLGADGGGGNISLNAGSIGWTSSGTTALNLSANGVGTGNGGSVGVLLTAPA